MVRRPIYSPTGEIYTILPRTLRLPQHAEDVLRALTDLGRRGVEVHAPDWLICEYLADIGKHHSRRYVQKGLKALQDLGLIVRETVRRITRGGIEVVRKISILLRFRGDPVPAPKVKLGKKLAPPLISHDIARGGAIQSHAGAVTSLSEVTEEEKQPAVGGEGDGTPPPPAVGEPQNPGDALAAIMAAAEAAAEAARTAQAASPPPRPVDRPSAPGVAPRERRRFSMALDVEAHARTVADNPWDKAAALALKECREALEGFDAQEARKSAADPPGVGSAPPIADPPA